MFQITLCIKECCALLSRSVMSDSAIPWTVAHQAPLSMGFSRQEYWSGLPVPSPGDLPDPGTEPRSPALQADSLLTELQRNLLYHLFFCFTKIFFITNIFLIYSLPQHISIHWASTLSRYNEKHIMENKEYPIPAFLELIVNLLKEKWHHRVIPSDMKRQCWEI